MGKNDTTAKHNGLLRDKQKELHKLNSEKLNDKKFINGKLYLPDITLIIIDCLNVKRAINAIEKSTKDFEFGEVKLLTSLFSDYPYTVKIDPINRIEAYSHFCIKKLNDYVDTKFVLVIQYDGYIIGDKSTWNNLFYDYDYIGSPWYHWNGTGAVGNGGFSLRSKKLLEILQKDESINEYHNEDRMICRKYRSYLETKYGIKFPTKELAGSFSKNNIKDKNQFGFHQSGRRQPIED